MHARARARLCENDSYGGPGSTEEEKLCARKQGEKPCSRITVVYREIAVAPPTPVLPEKELGGILFGHRVHRVGAALDFQRHPPNTLGSCPMLIDCAVDRSARSIAARAISELDNSPLYPGYRSELVSGFDPREIAHLSPNVRVQHEPLWIMIHEFRIKRLCTRIERSALIPWKGTEIRSSRLS